MTVVVMLVLLLTAAIMDIQRGKIPNWIILSGWFTAFCLALFDVGVINGAEVIKRIACVILCCWPLFLLHVIGAGDIKLWSVIAAMHSYIFLFNVMVVMFVIAGIFSVGIMCYRHLFIKRMQYMMHYFIWGRAYKKYYAQDRDGTQMTIRLAPFTFVAYCVVLIGRWRGQC